MEIQIIIAILLVIIVIAFQIWSFISTLKEIIKLQHYFPNSKNIKVSQNSIKKSDIGDDTMLDKILSNGFPGLLDDATILAQGGSPSDYTNIPLVACADKSCDTFINTTKELNAYLCKNNDVAGADFEIIKDIYESHIEGMRSSIQNNLNTPLLLGLAGTFIGIIIGLLGLDINGFFTGENINSISKLLYGVAIAMFASLFGLALTVINSAIIYKKANYTCETDKEKFFNILRKQLLPSLSSTMEQGLTSLKGVLGQFVGSFGAQLQGYTSAFQLLNDNIKQEHELLEKITQLNITKTSISIARSFGKLKDASDELVVFNKYQQSLNETVAKVERSVIQYETLINKFGDFFEALNMVVNNQNVASQMQLKFTEAIEQHFPTGSEGRDIWRKEYDLLVSDAQKTSEALQNELRTTTQYFANFVEENKILFNNLNMIPTTLASLSKYAELQTNCYNDLRTTIGNLMAQQKQNQLEIAEMNRSILEALKIVAKTIKDNK